ncbi:MAG: TldD/PmbA family protein [Dorea sp.]|nr:TldD/PmbA family protein [Dorea sp.]
MLTQKQIENILNLAMSAGADFAEVFDENTYMQETSVTQDVVERSNLGRDNGVGIRLFKNNECFYGFTNDKSEQKLLELTKDISKSMRGDSEAKLHVSLNHKNVFAMRPDTIYPSQMKLPDKLEPARRAVAAGMAYDPEIVRMDIKKTDYEQNVQIANSEGLWVSDTRVKTRLFIAAYAQSGSEIQSGYYGPGAMRGNDFYQDLDIEACARRAAEQAKILVHATPCHGGQMPVVVDNGFGGLLFHEACGHSLESTGIARDASEFCGMLGKRVASKAVTLIDDGSIADEWGSLHVDDEGIETQKNTLIENGILRGYMVDRLNGMRAGLAPTGSTRRQNYRFQPCSRMTNTYIAPGTFTPEQIIGATEKGLYVKSINGGSVDPATGEFNFNAGECYMIENGKITIPVRGVTLIGTGRDVLNQVDMVGKDFDLRQGYCFASSGALFIGAGQPTVRVKNMTVGGIG